MKLDSTLTRRNVAAFQVTEKLLAVYAPVFDEVFETLGTGLEVEWVNIDFHAANKVVVNVLGILKRKIGEMIRNDEGESIYIDATNVDNYARTIRMILPVHLIELADIDGLKLFVQETSAVIAQSSHDELDILFADDVFITNTFTAFKTNADITPPEAIAPVDTPLDRVPLKDTKNVKSAPKNQYEGFDLDQLELDDKQILSLRLMKPEGQA